MTRPEGNSEFCFRDEVEGNIEIRGKQNSLFPKGPVISDLLYCRFSLQVTKIQATKLLILLIFYFKEV